MGTEPDRIPPKLPAPIVDADIRYVSIDTAQEIQLKNLWHLDAFLFPMRIWQWSRRILLHSNAINVPKYAHAAANGFRSQ
jgi:hypothetical protein